jgi:hypothetical protein
VYFVNDEGWIDEMLQQLSRDHDIERGTAERELRAVEVMPDSGDTESLTSKGQRLVIYVHACNHIASSIVLR